MSYQGPTGHEARAALWMLCRAWPQLAPVGSRT